MDGFNFIQIFLANQRLNDYYNVAVDAAENIDPKNLETDENEENINPNSRYVQNLYPKKTDIGKFHKVSFCF